MKTAPIGNHPPPALGRRAEWTGLSSPSTGERTSSFPVQPTLRLAAATVLVYLLLSASFQTPRASAVPTYSFTLQSAVEKALKDNTIIREAVEIQKAQLEALKSAKADMLPKLSASYTYTRLKEAPFVVFGPSRFPIQDRDNVHWDLTITQPLFTGYALRTKKAIAELGVEIEKMSKAQAVLDVTERVKLAYFNILRSKKLLMVAEEKVKQLSAHLADAEGFYKQGLIPYNDLLKSKVALADAKQNRQRAAGRLAMAVSTFNALLGLDINAETEVEDVTTITPYTTDLDTLLAEAMENRPELRSLHLALKSAAKGVTLAKSAYYPEIDLLGRYERNGDNLTATNNDFANSHNASLMLQIRWTFFEWGRTRAEVSRARHNVGALAERMRRIEDNIRLEVKDAFLALRVAETNVRTAEEALVQAKEDFRITTLQYQTQLATSTDVLDAQTSLTNAETNYYNALYGYLTSLARLERAVGRELVDWKPHDDAGSTHEK